MPTVLAGPESKACDAQPLALFEDIREVASLRLLASRCYDKTRSC